MTEYTPFLVMAAALIALGFAAYKYFSVKRLPEGTEEMAAISAKIRRGAMAYLKRQYKTVAVFFVVIIILLTVLAVAGTITPFVPVAFLTGGLFSGLSGFIGMKISTYANSRTAQGAREGLNRGLKIAFSSGMVTGLTVVGLGLFDISFWFILLKFGFKLPIEDLTSTMLTFGISGTVTRLFTGKGGHDHG